MTIDVLCIGELNPDLILSGFGVDGPVLGTEQSFETQTLTLGSSTAISCVLMQRLGLKTALSALVGNDEHGRFCRETLNAEGVGLSGLRTHPTLSTGLTISLSYPDDRMLLTRYGTMTSFCAGDIDEALVSQAQHLHVGSFFIQSGLQPGLIDLFRSARSRGQTTSLDLGWDPAGDWDTSFLSQVLPYTSVVFPNRAELAGVTATEDVDDGLIGLHALGAASIALKLGSEGSRLSTNDGQIRHGGFPSKVVDTTGAGDAFNAGFVRAMLDDASPEDRLALGNACGALTARGAGGIGGLDGLMQARRLTEEERL